MAEAAEVEILDDRPGVRTRLSGFLEIDHAVLGAIEGVELAEGAIRLRRGPSSGRPLGGCPTRREDGAALLIQAASAALFLRARGFPLASPDFESARVEADGPGSPSLRLTRVPRSVVSEPVAPEPVSATLAAFAARLVSAGGPGAPARQADFERLLAALLDAAAAPQRSDFWFSEIFRILPWLGEPAFAGARRRCPGFHPRGFDEMDRLFCARAAAARLVLEGRKPRILSAGPPPLEPGSALASSFGVPGAAAAELALRFASERTGETHWLRVSPERWDPVSRRLSMELAELAGVELIDFDAPTGPLYPDELREAVWVPAPGLAASVELYEALHASLALRPGSWRGVVAALVSSPQYGEFLRSGRVPTVLFESRPERARACLEALSAPQRRAVGLSLLRPDSVPIPESAQSEIAIAASRLGEDGWMAGSDDGAWRAADECARADLLAAFPPQELRSLFAEWLPKVRSPVARLDFASRAGLADAVAAAASELFPPGVFRRRPELDGAASRILADLAERAGPEVRFHEAIRLEDEGLPSRSRELLLSLLADGKVAGPARAELSLRLARSWERAGDASRAAEAYEPLACSGEAPAELRSRALRGLARISLASGAPEEARARLDGAESLEGLPPGELLELALARADFFSRIGDFEQEARIYERARSDLSSGTDVDLQVRFLLREGTWLSDRREDRAAAARFAEALAAAGSDPERRGSALMDLAIALDHLGRSNESEASFRGALGLLERSGNRPLERRALGNLACYYVNHGRSDLARDLLDRLLRESRSAGDATAVLVALSQRSRLELRDGDFAAAERERKEALDLARELGDRYELADLEIDESDSRIYLGDPAGARESLERASRQVLARGAVSRWVEFRRADLSGWMSSTAAEASFSDPIESLLESGEASGAERVARARAFFGPEFEKAHPALCARARSLLRKSGREGLSDAVFGAGALIRDLPSLRKLREDLLREKVPLRLRTADGRELWRSGAFAEASWSRPVRCGGRELVLDGEGPHAEEAAFLFETSWIPAAEPVSEDDPGRGLTALARAGLVAADRSMDALGQRLLRVAAQNLTVCIGGESGTGKEKIARAIHAYSTRAAGPFVAVNIAAFPEHLLEDELFGHARGAFTGAERDRMGLFESANGGTLFLDEIGDLSPNLQAKLLRVLQEREVRRLGENRNRKVDVRLVTATAKSLEKAVEAGTFREDLYYRVKVASLALPPLRERGGDALLLARHFLERFAAEYGKGALRFSTRTAAAIRTAAWPGNVRQLQNCVMEAAALADADSVVEITELREVNGGSSGSYRERVEEFRRRLVAEALERHRGNRTHAARELGITRQALAYLLRSLRP